MLLGETYAYIKDEDEVEKEQYFEEYEKISYHIHSLYSLIAKL